jgi:hypothetical protein
MCNRLIHFIILVHEFTLSEKCNCKRIYAECNSARICFSLHIFTTLFLSAQVTCQYYEQDNSTVQKHKVKQSEHIKEHGEVEEVQAKKWLLTSTQPKQQMKCTYNSTLRRVRESLLPWRRNKYYIFVCVRACACLCVRACSLAYPACNAYAPYCDVICGPHSLHHIFRHYLINGAIFGKESY